MTDIFTIRAYIDALDGAVAAKIQLLQLKVARDVEERLFTALRLTDRNDPRSWLWHLAADISPEITTGIHRDWDHGARNEIIIYAETPLPVLAHERLIPW